MLPAFDGVATKLNTVRQEATLLYNNTLFL